MSREGICAAERAILDLWDQGLGTVKIARRLGLDERRVRKIVNTYVGGDDRGQRPRDIAAGTAALAAALRRAHPELFHVEAV